MKSLFLLAAVVGVSSQAHAFGVNPSCNTMFRQEVELGIPLNVNADGSWRAKITNAMANGNVAPTSQAREAWIRDAAAAQLTFLNKTVDTPELVIATAEGVQMSVPKIAIDNPSDNPIPLNYTKDAKNQGFQYEEVAKVKVSGLGPSGILKATMLLPASGHTGLNMTKVYAAKDLYDIKTREGGNGWSNRGIEKTIVASAPSKGVITLQEIEVQLKPGVPTRVEYWRHGSGGPGGYEEGRVIEFTWDGK